VTAVIIGTGSRVYKRPDIVRLVLSAVATRYGGDVVLRYGAAKRGADRFMADTWTRMGLKLDPFPADWNGPCDTDCDHGPRRPHGQGEGDYCPAAGPRRNLEMIAKGAAEVHGFPAGRAAGTMGTLAAARGAGLSTFTWWEHDAGKVLAYAGAQLP
jgi:hypothetical protein